MHSVEFQSGSDLELIRNEKGHLKETSRHCVCTKAVVIYPCHKFTVPNGKFGATTFYIFIHNAICNTIWMIYNYKIKKKKKKKLVL